MPAPVVVVTGPPGAGKSTVSEILVRRYTPGALVPGDGFFAFLREGYVDPWLPEAHAQNEVVVEAAAAAAGRLATGGITVVYDGMISPWFRDTFHAATGVASMHYAVLMPTEELCLERVRTRVGHGFTDLDAARHMYREFADSGLDGRHLIPAAASDCPGLLADRVAAAVASGTLLI